MSRSDEIQAGGASNDGEDTSAARLVPIRIGEATIFLEQAGVPAEVQPSDEIHPVALPSPEQAFEHAGAFLGECVGIFDERIRALTHRPKEISVEFSLAFEVKGKATLIPILLSGETSTNAAIKVSVKWGPADSTP